MTSTSLSVVSSATANRGGVPAWVGAPEVRGIAEVDRKLSVRIPAGSYTYTPTLRYARPLIAWQWKRDGVAIAGATDPVYVPVVADQGKALTCTVTLTGEYGSASATSGSTISYTYRAKGATTVSDTTTSNVIGANTAVSTYDLQNSLGWKTSATTGSMTAGSNILVVADASGFAIGDQIIVATGGEAGGGAKGTLGVGGSWPALYYADATARDADASKATDTFCWIQSTGRVYRWDGAVWQPQFSTTYDYFYTSWATPRALVTTIANKSGDTLTLAATAVVSTTNANVYFDCWPAAEATINTGLTSFDNGRLYLRTGRYAFSKQPVFYDTQKMYFEGDGPSLSVMFSPDGCNTLQVYGIYNSQLVIRNVGIEGNHKLNSWGVWPGTATEFASYGRGVLFQNCYDTLLSDVRSYQTMNDAFNLGAGSNDSGIVRPYCRHVAPVRVYLQWSINISDSEDCHIIDPTVISDYIVPGIELFRASRSSIIRFTGQNAVLSQNTVGAFWIDTPTITIKANSIYNYDPLMSTFTQNWTLYGALLNINTNIANTSGYGIDLAASGGAVVNANITIEGFMESVYKTRNTAIIVAPDYTNVMIKGGSITFPSYVSPSNEVIGVGSDGDGWTVAGMRFIGFDAGTDLSVRARNSATQGHGRVVDCIGENIQARVNQRNQTNAEYIAAGGV